MGFARMFLASVALYAGVCLCLSDQQNASKFDGAAKNEPLVITNTTRNFVEKVFKQYTDNNTKKITVEDFYQLLNTLKIGKVFEVSGYVEVLDKDKKRTRRDLTDQIQRISKDKNTDNHNQRFHNNCITKDRLLDIHQISKDKPITSNDFIKLCPSLVYEVQSGSCWHSPNAVTVMAKSNSFEVWLYGILSITVISLSSLLAIAILPCLEKAIYNKIMAFLVALAVGTLSGDAFLHLIPHAFMKGIHNDEEGEEEHVNPLWKGVVIMSGIYLFFIIESFMKVRMTRHQHHHDVEEQEQNIDEGVMSPLHNDPLVKSKPDIVNHNHCSPDDCDEANRKTKGFTSRSGDSTYMTDLSQSDTGLDSVHYSDNGTTIIKNRSMYIKDELNDNDDCCSDDTKADYSDSGCDALHCHNTSQLSARFQSNANGTDVSVGEILCESEKIPVIDNQHNGHHHHGNKSIDKDTTIASVAWMVIVGDGFHNLSDGLAVGAAFSSSLTTGLTTAIAVLCHELPHELGDFAILIKSGMAFKQAIAYNMASALISYIGLVIGIGVGNLDTSHVWVLALTSGMFLYISLVSMLPELKAYQEKGSYSIFFSQNAGILTGILIMLIIALFEKH